MTDLAALMRKLERATEGSRLLDAHIHVAVGALPKGWESGVLWVDDKTELVEIRYSFDGRKSRGNPPLDDFPHYTSSRDAAILAFPAGWFHQVEPRFDIPDREVIHWWRVYGILPRPDQYVPSGGWFENVEAKHANEYLAIVLAALKARSAA